MIVDSVTYHLGDTAFQGVIVHDEIVTAPQPLVLLAPDWMGVTDGAIASAMRLAAQDFIVFVADMYGQGVRPDGPDAAAKLVAPLKADSAAMRARARAALAALTREAAARKLAAKGLPSAVGFCFGGLNVLELARDGVALATAVSIHGDFTTGQPARPGGVAPAVLVLHGADDPIAPKAQRDAFEAEMDAAGARWSMMVFGGAVHSFTNPRAAVAGVAMFDPVAARVAFRMTRDFLLDAYA